jgi:hypothetical protein
VEVQRLGVGDSVVTASGETKRIRWVGAMRLEKGAAGWNRAALPVRVLKDAFGEGNPRRDLYLSQTHMVYLGGVLIPVGDLLNGVTIALAQPESDALDYFHVELDSHDVLLAEGAPCESLLGNRRTRMAFDNYHERVALYGEAETAMLPYAPIAAFNGGRGELKSRLRSVIAPLADRRQPLDIVRDRLEARAASRRAA